MAVAALVVSYGSHASGNGSGDKRLGPVREAVVSRANRSLVPVVLEDEEFR